LAAYRPNRARVTVYVQENAPPGSLRAEHDWSMPAHRPNVVPDPENVHRQQWAFSV
jgi:hypothetical protein